MHSEREKDSTSAFISARTSCQRWNNKTSNIHAWRYFETSIASFSELREPILMILGAKWPHSHVLSNAQNAKNSPEDGTFVFWEKLIFMEKMLGDQILGVERNRNQKSINIDDIPIRWMFQQNTVYEGHVTQIWTETVQKQSCWAHTLSTLQKTLKPICLPESVLKLVEWTMTNKHGGWTISWYNIVRISFLLALR